MPSVTGLCVKEGFVGKYRCPAHRPHHAWHEVFQVNFRRHIRSCDNARLPVIVPVKRQVDFVVEKKGISVKVVMLYIGFLLLLSMLPQNKADAATRISKSSSSSLAYFYVGYGWGSIDYDIYIDDAFYGVD